MIGAAPRHARRARIVAAAFVLLALSSHAAANEPLFRALIGVNDGVTGPEANTASANDIRQLSDQFTTENLERLFSNQNFSNPDQVGVAAGVNLRGVPLFISFPSGSATLTVSLPSIQRTITFTGADRDESLQQFEDWLRGLTRSNDPQGDALTALLQELVARSPVDPIAGNPSSLQSRMFEAAFATATTGLFRPEPGTPEAAEWTGEDLFRVNGGYEYFQGGPWQGNVFELGLDYQLNFRNPKWAVLFDLPVIITQTQSAESYLVSAGLGVQFRPTHWWNITPSFRLGGAGSFKLGAVAIMPNVNLTSSMRWSLQDKEVRLGEGSLDLSAFELGIGNMVGWNGTFDDLEIADIRIAYDLDNYAIRNGIELTYRFSARWLGAAPTAKLFFVDTWILGSRLFLDHYNELGVELGTQRRTNGTWRDALAFDVSWAFGDRYDALRLRASYRF